MTKNGKKHLKKLTFAAIFAAIATVLMILELPALLMPGFIKFDFSNLPVLFAGFSLGPLWGVACCLIKDVIHIPFGGSAGIGDLADFLISAAFVAVASVIFRSRKTFKASIVGCLAGSAAMAVVSFPVNLFITYPFYERFMPVEAIIKAYSEILPVNTLPEALLIFNVPFTFIKGIIISVLCILMYKYVRPLLVKSFGELE